jgi:uncharacterized protein (TIRG00374 family)
MKLLFRALALAVGLGLLIWFIRRAESGEILAAFSRLGWLAPLILIPYGLVYLADTRGWQLAFGAKARHCLPFPTLLRIRWAGEAVNNVIPSAYVGGEALKVYLLNRRGVEVAIGATSVVAGKTAQTIGHIVFLSIAAGALAIAAAGESHVQHAAFAVIGALVVGVTGLLWLQKVGPFSGALRLVEKCGLRLKSVRKKMERLRLIDERILEFYREDRNYFCLSIALYFAGWILGTVEVLVIAALLGESLQISQAIVMEAFVGIAKVSGIVVPGALGFQESGIVLLCRAVAVPDSFAFAYAILRRGREVVFAIIGLLFAYSEEIKFRTLLNRPSATSEIE